MIGDDDDVSPISPAAEKMIDATGATVQRLLIDANARLQRLAGAGEPVPEMLAAVCIAHVCAYLRRYASNPPQARAVLEGALEGAFESDLPAAPAKRRPS